jgi:hypothetical protein
MSRYSPPALACWLLESVLPAPYREAMVGDLIEGYAVRVESSPLTAYVWFWSQACRSIPSMFLTVLRTGNWFMSVSVAIGVYIVMGALKFAADLMTSKLVAPEQTMQVVLAPIVFLATTTIGGCVAERIHGRSTVFLAMIVMITVVVMIYLKLCTIPVPWWYPFGFLTLGPLSVLISPAVFRMVRAKS